MENINNKKRFLYSPVSLEKVLRKPGEAANLKLLGVLVVSSQVCIAFGIAAIKCNWSGIPVKIASSKLHLTIYPPMIIGTLLTLLVF